MVTTTHQRPIDALIFDMDGLLVDSETLAGEAIVALFRRHGREVNLEAQDGQRLMVCACARSWLS